MDRGGDLANQGFSQGHLFRGEGAALFSSIEANGANHITTGDDGEDGHGLDAALVDENVQRGQQGAGLGIRDHERAARAQHLLGRGIALDRDMGADGSRLAAFKRGGIHLFSDNG